MTQYSHSRLSCFENCPRQFEYRYIQRIEVETEGIEAFLGKRVHEILERLYHHVARHGRPPSLSQVQERFRKDWRLHWHDGIEIVRKENPEEFYLLHGERCLENYYRQEYPFDRGETIGLELRIPVRLDDQGCYQARGIIDRLTKRSGGRYEIHDYKTGSFLPSARRLDEDRQLGLYQIGLEQTFPDVEEVDLVWHFLAFNRTHRSRRTATQLESLRARTTALIDTIESAESYPARPGPLCRWCGYRALCPEAPREKEEAGAGPGVGAPTEPGGSTGPVGAAPGGQLSLLD